MTRKNKCHQIRTKFMIEKYTVQGLNSFWTLLLKQKRIKCSNIRLPSDGKPPSVGCKTV